MHVFYAPDIAINPELPEEEAGHCLRVLRLSIGDEVTLTDGIGNFYKAVISATLSSESNRNHTTGKRVEWLSACGYGTN